MAIPPSDIAPMIMGTIFMAAVAGTMVVQLEQRVSELEERMDFAERLLARPDVGVRLPGRGEAG